tara:strand:+ start:360 stop:512 length:153 start_codon:yes stop_codon:yes gene_type:complete
MLIEKSVQMFFCGKEEGELRVFKGGEEMEREFFESFFTFFKKHACNVCLG